MAVASRTVRHLFEGTGAFPWIGLGFVVLSVLFVASILLSPDGWQWWLTAKTVHGSEQDGLVYYTYGGSNYAVSDPNSLRTGSRTVYVISSNPSAGALSDAGTILDWTVTAGPVVVAAGFVAWGFRRRSQINRRHAARQNGVEGTSGGGLDSETVRRLIAEQKTGGQRRTTPSTATQDPPND